MKFIYRIFLFFAFLIVSIVIITFARGYRLDFKKQSLTSTGIIAISAYPKAAKVYINGTLKGVSDLNITLPPGVYEVEVKKDGYTSWEKKVSLKGELVLTLDVLLYPLQASLSPLTNLAVSRAIPISQSDKVLLFSEQDDEAKDGIYLFERGIGPLSFYTPLKLIVLKKSLRNALGEISFRETKVDVSPDTKEAIFTFETSSKSLSYLLSLDPPSGENLTFFDITSSKETLTGAWSKLKEELNQKILQAYPKEFAKVASDSFHVIEFSPDETKLLFLAKRSIILPQAIAPALIAVNQTPEIRSLETNGLYIYDKKEDRNYKIDLINLIIDLISKQNKNSLGQLDQLEIGNFITWYSDSKHIVINEGGKISFIDYDDQNKQTVYSGAFDRDFFKVSSDGRILILTNLNPEANKFPDLYAVGIR